MKKRKTSLLIAKFFVSLLLVFMVIKKINLSEVLSLVRASEMSIIGIAAFMIVINLCLATYRWQILMLSEHSYSYLSLLKLLFISHTYNMLIPGSVAGDIFRAVKTNIATIVMDRLVGMIGMVMLWLLGFAFSFPLVVKTGLLPYLAGVSLLLCLLTILLLSPALSRKIRWVGILAGPFREKIKDIVLSVQSYRHHYRKLSVSVLLTLSAHLLLVTATFLIASSLKAPISYFNCILFVPIIGLLSSLPATVGGLGIREASFVLLFSSVGVKPEISLGVSFLFYLILLILALVGLLCLFLPSRIPAPKEADIPVSKFAAKCP